MAVVIKTDHKWKIFIFGFQLPKEWRKEFNWIKSDEEYNNSLFVKVKVGEGRKKNNIWYYALEEFAIFTSSGWLKDFPGWDGYLNDTYFSGNVIKISKDGERYQIGYFYT